MKKIEITQDDLDQGTEKFHLYMLYVKHRIAGLADPRMAVFTAIDTIQKDGYRVIFGSRPDNAGKNVSNWIDEYYGDRSHISYCFPSIACEIDGSAYLLRMPLLRVDKIPLTQAVIDITESSASSISSKRHSLLEQEYTDYYNALYNISVFNPASIIHISAAANYILHSKATYALARWESLSFVEKTMKEILRAFDIKMSGADGHDIQGALHTEWKNAGLPALPEALLSDVMCTTAMRYQETPQPFAATLKAHHSSVRLGAIISKQKQAMPHIENEFKFKIKDMSLDPCLHIARLVKAIDPLAGNSPKVHLIR
ncbi:hypothetical protein [Pseudomonas sp. NFACC08-1]|uniref:hypothetical protein n=1 Tax=Pseudomonas sp. NFACC08-1 TaxID=1566238 RepID=UPI0008995E58|nr:hypothetical protein [Pseudomonas sp. NFACC08-1]SDY38527.1 hypothetical protein SAMN03159474_05347 [Pseudomonas sp. NFACC08-1]